MAHQLSELPQPLLPGIDDDAQLGAELLLSKEDQRARFSGKIVDKNQERVDGILNLLAAGAAVRLVCRAFHVSPHTLATLRERHGVKLATIKQGIARKSAMFVELGVDRLLSEVDRMDVDKLAFNVKVILDSMQLMSGEATVIVGSDGPRRFDVASLQAKLAAKPVINVTPMSSDAGKQFTIAAEITGDSGCSDTQSEINNR
jgi:hypothetical protein